MRWKTAKNHLRCQDQGVVTHLEYGHRLYFPTGPTNIRLVHSEDDTLLGTVTQPEVNEEVEQLLKQVGLPDTGWVPGPLRFNSAHTKSILSQILDTVRLLTPERAEVSLAQLRTAMCAVDDRLFQIHVLHLLEDAQGLVAVDEACTSVRLATWREAMRVAQELIEQTKELTNVDDLEPKIQLLSDGRIVCWIGMIQSEGCYCACQTVGSYASMRGNEKALDLFLQEQMIPSSGWAATYEGLERERLEPRDPEKEEQERLTFFAEMAQLGSDARYTLVSPTLLSISFRNDPEGKKLHHMDMLMQFGYQAYLAHSEKEREASPSLYFGFEKQEDLERARALLKLPVEMQAGPRIAVRPQPVSTKRRTLKTLLFGGKRS